MQNASLLLNIDFLQSVGESKKYFTKS